MNSKKEVLNKEALSRAIGKTILSAVVVANNVVVFTFTDGTTLMLNYGG